MANRNKSRIHTKFSIISGCIFTVLFFAAPIRADIFAGIIIDEMNVGTGYDYDQINCPLVQGTLNLYPGAEIYHGIMPMSGCTINFYGGQMMGNIYIAIFGGGSSPDPKITVYGSKFAVNGQPCDPLATSFKLVLGTFSTLTGFYENGDPINVKFYGNISINLVTLGSKMEIDIKPGDEQNVINLESKGVVPVAVLTTDHFDAATIDFSSARFAGAAPAKWSLEDVDGDGDDDVIFHFRTQELDLTKQSTEATLTAQLSGQKTMMSLAQTSGGAVISGTDKVNIVGAKKLKN